VGRVTIDVNQTPVASSFSAQIARTQQFVIPVTSLATDREPLVISALEGAPDWVAIVDAQRTLLIDPAGRFGRLDMVAVVADPGGLTVRVPIAVELVNLAPTANPDAVRVQNGPVEFAPLANDTDPDGDPVSLQSVPAAVKFPNGVDVEIQRLDNGTLRLIPHNAAGTATFVYTVVDALGLVSNETTVTLIINAAPTVVAVPIELPADSTLDIDLPVTDPDGDPLILEILDDPTPLTIQISGLRLTIIAPPEAVGQTFDLRYRVTDPFGLSGTEFLRITVTDPVTTTTTTTVPPSSVPGTPAPPAPG
jgi:hypothetical protein